MPKNINKRRLSEPILDSQPEIASLDTSVSGLKRRETKSTSSAGGGKGKKQQEADPPTLVPVEQVATESSATVCTSNNNNVLVVAYKKRNIDLIPQGIQQYKAWLQTQPFVDTDEGKAKTYSTRGSLYTSRLINNSDHQIPAYIINEHINVRDVGLILDSGAFDADYISAEVAESLDNFTVTNIPTLTSVCSGFNDCRVINNSVNLNIKMINEFKQTLLININALIAPIDIDLIIGRNGKMFLT